MSNRSLYNEFNSASSNPISNMGNFLKAFNDFRSTFSGDPEAQVKQLLSSGRLSQEQFNQFAATANQLKSFIK